MIGLLFDKVDKEISERIIAAGHSVKIEEKAGTTIGKNKVRMFIVNGQKAFAYLYNLADRKQAGNANIEPAPTWDPREAVQTSGRKGKGTWGKRVVLNKCGQTNEEILDYVSKLIISAVEGESMFTWLPFYEELAIKLLDYEDRQKELVDALTQAGVEKGLVDEKVQGDRIPLEDMDPFSFFAAINKYNPPERTKRLEGLKPILGIKADVPQDFAGVPTAQPLQAMFFSFSYSRGVDDIKYLWDLFRSCIAGNPTEDQFSRVLALPYIGKAKLTQGMFWAAPKRYLPIDSQTTPYLAKNKLPNKYEDFTEYLALLEKVQEAMPGTPFYQISYDAWRENTQGEIVVEPIRTKQYWMYAPGRGGEFWDEFYQKGIMGIGWEYLGDLSEYHDKEEIAQKMREHENEPDSSKKNNATSCYSMAFEMQVGDVVFAKIGLKKIVGMGVVEGDYYFDESRGRYNSLRKVKWLTKGEWEVDDNNKVARKTLTNITRYKDFLVYINNLIGTDKSSVQEPQADYGGTNYWWLNANPKQWNLEDYSVGQKQTYTAINEKGNKRQKYKYFEAAKPGDIVVGYSTTPKLEITALLEVTKGLHETDEGLVVEFIKTDQLLNTVKYSELQVMDELKTCEPIVSNQGSLFRLSKDEFEVIRDVIDERNIIAPKEKVESYSDADALSELFIGEREYYDIKSLLEYKRNIILQGPPGVGKTFFAKRLAYAVLGQKNKNQVEMIQFHQSYAYEDFIQGYRPNEKGKFDLMDGVFYRFCRRAQIDKENKYFFVIDEINRGNLSKIFGELMMLIEADKRGKDFAIPLTYARNEDDKFYLPDNLYIIGTMNTADRSLAMVDYALRRRFSFVDLNPGFEYPKFSSHLTSQGLSDSIIKRISERITLLNGEIEKESRNLGKGFCIGHSYFCNAPLEGQDENDWYNMIVNREIAPLVNEYWFDNADKAAEVVEKLLQ